MSHKTGQYAIEDEIDGVKIASTVLMPLDVYRLAPRVAKIFLPVLQMQDTFKRLAPILMRALGGKSALNADDVMRALSLIDVKDLQPVLSCILDGLALPENARLPVELLCRTQLHERDEEGIMRVKQLTSDADINDAFRGKPRRMLMVMWAAAVFNFTDFFTGGQPSAQIKDWATATPTG